MINHRIPIVLSFSHIVAQKEVKRRGKRKREIKLTALSKNGYTNLCKYKCKLM
ncbi:hypothetical protein PPA04_12980 [Pediococcus parvulus]|nr:hypothetical protein PPA04_12980 [Pediococcus parvulus]